MPLSSDQAAPVARDTGFGGHLLQLLLVGVGAGLIAAVVLTILQTVTTTPLILAAEVYESGAATPVAEPAAESQGHGGHAHHGAAAAAEDSEPLGLGRLTGTAVANAAIGIGFGLILTVVATNLLASVQVGHGLALGVAGFLAAALAPALGLPPALPGSAEIPLEPRQLWWLCAVLSTAVGLLVLWRGGKLRWLGLAALVFPHALGAPTAPIEPGIIPAALATRFVAASLVDAAVLWLVLGAAVGWLLGRTGSRA